MNKGIKYALIVASIGLVAYNSVYVRKLSEVKATVKAEEEKTFDAIAYAKDFLFNKIPAKQDKALPIDKLVADLRYNPRKAFAQSHAQNNGDIRFFMVQGEGVITKIDESNTYLKVEGLSSDVILATEYIIGNAARDGSGLISVDEFNTTMDMNTVSEEINKLIRSQVLPPFEEKAKVGSTVSFTGCTELNQTKALPKNLEVIPLLLQIK